MRARARLALVLSTTLLSIIALSTLTRTADPVLAQSTPTPPPPPQWTVSFNDVTDPVSLGGSETWTLIATNPFPPGGPVATGATVTASFPGFTLASASGSGWTCSLTSSTTATCSRTDTLPAGQSYPTITFSGTAQTCGMTTSSATVSGGGPSARTVSATTTIACPDLTITKTDAVDPIAIGQTETWTITVTNFGSFTVSGGVTVTDAVPSNFTNVSAAGPGWSCTVSGNNVSCSRTDTLGAGASYPPITITALAQTCGTAVNTAQFLVSSSLSLRPQQTSSGGTATTTITCPAPALSIAKNDAVDPITQGQTQTWSVVVSNGAGTSTAPAGAAAGTFTVTDTVPSAFVSVTATGAGWSCTVQGNTVTCTRSDTLAPGTSLPPITVQATAVICGSTVTNTATLTFTGTSPVSPLTATAATTILCVQTRTLTPTIIELPTPVTSTPTPTPPPPPTPPPATATAPPVMVTSTPTVPPPTATTARPTATPTPPPPTPTVVGQPPSQPEGVRYQSSRYISGANPMREGQTTRVEVTYILTNNTNEVVDYSNTVTFDLAEGVTAVSAMPSLGTATISTRQVAWGGFVLNPGQSATITMVLDVVPAPGSAGNAVTLITGTTTTGRTASGGLVNERGGGLSSTAISGLASGGFVLATVPGGTPAALPRTGSGSGSGGTVNGQRAWLALTGVLAAGLVAALSFMLRKVRHHE